MASSAQYQSLSIDENEVSTQPRRMRSMRSLALVKRVVDTTNAITQKCVSFVRLNAGLLLVAASQGFFALTNVAVKKLNSLDPPVPALELVAVRMGITYICCLSYLLWRKVPDPYLGPKGVRHLLVVRGFSGFFGLFGVYYSLQYLSLSDATVLTFLIPLATAISGFFFLGEVFHRREAVAGVLSLVGVVLIARPEVIFGPHSVTDEADSFEKATSAQRIGAVGVALLGVLGGTGAYTSMRAIGKRAHTLHSMSYFSLWCVLTSTVGMVTLRQNLVFPTRLEWLALLIMIGIFGFLAQALLTMGLQRETAGRGAMAIYVQIIFATVFERVFFHTVPSALSIIGTLIIMSSAVYVALTKQTTQAPKTGETTDSVIALDLELGVAEPETQRFLTHDNASHLQVLRQESRKNVPMVQPGTLSDGFKSEVSLHVPREGEDGIKGNGEDVPDEEGSLTTSLGFTGQIDGEDEGTVVFDVGEESSSFGSSPTMSPGSGSETNFHGDDDDEVDNDRRHSLHKE